MLSSMNLPENFKTYLKFKGASTVTIKNYAVDCKHFLRWLYQKTKVNYRLVGGKEIFSLFTSENLKAYKNNLCQSNTSLATVNRRFSTLRKFGEFANSRGWLSENPALKIKNAVLQKTDDKNAGLKIMLGFKKYLEREKISPVTVKNYLSDLRHFLSWLKTT